MFENVARNLTFAGMKRQFSPQLLATSAPFEDGKSTMATFSPRFIKNSTVAFPRPEAPPVTNATSP